MRLARWAVLWAALIALPCAPVLAQGTGEEGRDGNVTIVDCSQVQNAFVQGQYGNANASAQYDSEAIAIVAQELNISQDQVNLCLVNLGDNDDADNDDADNDDADNDDADAGDADAGDAGDVIASTVPETDELPKTGGPSGIVLAAGCALLGVGLIVNRIFR